MGFNYNEFNSCASINICIDYNDYTINWNKNNK